MGDWFRSSEWNEDIAASFEARLSRARQKAQYLILQAYALLGTRSKVAAQLLRRVIAMDDPEHNARANLYLGTALAIAGDVDGAIAALESAIEAEARFPMHRTAAYLDQALLVALLRRRDLYNQVLTRLQAETVLPFEDQLLSALLAQCLIRGERGEDVGEMAKAALDALGASDESFGEIPHFASVKTLRIRLEALSTR